jgi:HSP20 family protein
MSSRWEAFDHLTGLRESVGDMLDRRTLFGTRTDRGADAAPGAQAIPVNIFEAEDFLMVIAPMPGVQEEDLDITVRGNTMTVEATERADLKPESGKRYLRHEWRYGPYRRMIELPYAVDADTAAATFHNGVLTVRVQQAEAERMRRIQVKTTRPARAGEPGSWQAGEPTRQA